VTGARHVRRGTWACAALVLATSSALAAPALADERPVAQGAGEPSPSGVRLALRSGVAVPVGEAFVASGALSDTIAGYVPLRLDLGYRLTRYLYVGAVGQMAVIVPSGCPAGGSCAGSDSRFGAMVAIHLLPSRVLDPWFGVGMGVETLRVSRAAGGSKVDITARGFELLDVDLGVDVRATRALRIGPVLSTSLGRFSSFWINDTKTRDFDTSLHAWVMAGLRGAFDL
jgi:hypothetical protein